MSTTLTQKTYKVSISGLCAFGSLWYSSGPSTRISSSAFSQLGSGYQVGLGTNMKLAGGLVGLGVEGASQPSK